jgi:hypothetical protein
MIVKIFSGDIKHVVDETKSTNSVLTNHQHKPDARRSDIDLGKLSTDEFHALKARIEYQVGILDGSRLLLKGARPTAGNAKYFAGQLRTINEFESLLRDSDETTVIKKLDMMPSAIRSGLKHLPNRWVFVQDSDSKLNPYYIENVTHTKGYTDRSTGRWVPPVVTMKVKGYRRGSQVKESFNWGPEDIAGDKSIQALMLKHDMHIETEKAVDDYKAEVERYMKLQTLVGVQMLAFGFGKTITNSHYRWTQLTSFVREGQPTKVVLDDEGDDESDTSAKDTFTDDRFWRVLKSRKKVSRYDDDEEQVEGEIETVQLPVHPYLGVFDLDRHAWAVIHSSNLDDYAWDKSLIDKLVIDDKDKRLVNMLVSQSRVRIDDIIKGKMSGVIILATGEPGTGKTLTAEVFSELIEKPLYNVQCSQLGIDVDSVEKKLRKILDRANRWGAILIIDEADVYIRERGDDIEQNAIVGVFLRVLEYYRGILFMTSNRGNSIDDAIASRATAWINYKMPSLAQLRELWTVLGTNYGFNFTGGQIDILTDPEYGLNEISGRSVRNLLKLARMLKPEGQISVQDILDVAEYQKV